MKRLLYVITALLLLGAGYLTYDKWVKHSRLSTWSFVPSDAALVVDIDVLNDYHEFKYSTLWQNLSNTQILDNIKEGLNFLDSINGEDGFTAIFEETPVLISTHKVTNTSIDFLFVVDIQNLSQNTFISAAIGRLKEHGYRFRTRNYNGFNISEISSKDHTFTYLFYKHYFLGSFTPYLVEDAIRTIDDKELLSFDQVYRKGQKGKVHINYQQFSKLLASFVSGSTSFPVKSGSYDLAIDSTFIHLSGLSSPNTSLQNHEATPSTFEMASVIPTNTAILYHYSSSDVNSWKEKQLGYLAKSTKTQKLNDSLSRALDYHPNQVFDLLDEEIGLALLESGRPDDHNKLFILKVADVRDAEDYFQQIEERSAYARGDSIYSESYSEREIRFFPIRDFPKTILGDIASGFDQCFYVSFRNYIIFSNNLQELKSLVTSTSSEDIWGKSIQMREFLDNANEEANVSLFVNIPRAWTFIKPLIKTEWQDFAATNSQAMLNMELAAFQFSWIDGHYYTNYTFSQPQKAKPVTLKTNADNAVIFTNNITSKPHLVKSHAHKDFNIIVQDTSNTVYFLNRSFSTLWTENVNEPITSEIYEIDYYRNNKLQYIFSTTSRVHILDRLGNYIPGYPKTLRGGDQLQHLNLIDYNKSRNYRIAVTTSDGHVYLTDKELKPLTGWDPIPYRREAIQPLQHARLGGRDLMISIQKDGVLNVSNRRGKQMPGFPFDIQSDLDNQYFLNESNSLGSSTINVLTNQGELIEINLKGIVINREQLIKDTPSTSFSLVQDIAKKSFILLRKEGSIVDVLDATGNLLFSKDYLSNAEIRVQYYRFGAEKDLIVFTDTANKALYMYDKQGNLVTGTPLKSAYEVALIYSSYQKELQAYTCSNTELNYYKIQY